MAISDKARRVPDNYTQLPVVVASERGIYLPIAEQLKEGATVAHLHCYRSRALPRRAGLVWWDVTESAYGCQMVVNNRYHSTVFRKSMKALVTAVHKSYQMNPDVDWKPGYVEDTAKDTPDDGTVEATGGSE